MATSFPGPTVLFINSPSGKSGTGDPGIPVLYVLDSGSMDKNNREELVALFIMIIIITVIRRASGSLVDHRGELRTSCLPGVECELLCHSAILFRHLLTTLYYLLWKHTLRLVHLPQIPWKSQGLTWHLSRSLTSIFVGLVVISPCLWNGRNRYVRCHTFGMPATWYASKLLNQSVDVPITPAHAVESL